VVPIRDDLRALEGYHSPQVDVKVRLNTNESPLPPPTAWGDAFAAELSRVEWHRYPDRQATELRAAIAELHHVSPDMVFAANGSNEVLQTILLTYAGPGRTVATFEPTYQMHAQIARVTGSNVIEGERNADFSLDPAEIRRVVETARPHVVFLTSPNNPTGLVEPAARVSDLLSLAPGLVVVDEAYSTGMPASPTTPAMKTASPCTRHNSAADGTICPATRRCRSCAPSPGANHRRSHQPIGRPSQTPDPIRRWWGARPA
jgi:histidinol-phosphate aminotransferase